MFGLSKLYTYLIAGGAALALLAGFGFYFYEKGNSHAQVAISHYQADKTAQTQIIQAKENASNDQIIIKYVDRDKIITQWKTQYVKAEADLPPSTNLSNGWVNLHDASVSETAPANVNDASDSGISQGKALDTIISNYSSCEANKNQLLKLQEAINKDNQIISAPSK